MSDNWEEVVAPQGAFIGWGRIDQQVTGEVISYSDTAGTDYNDKPCPEVVLLLVAPCENWTNLKKSPTKVNIAAGEFVTVTCGLANLKKMIRAAALDKGNTVRITYTHDEPNPKGDVKVFAVAVSRDRRAQPSSESLV